jgi:sugar phosphate isomerase/epimerase
MAPPTALLTDALEHLSFPATLEWCAERGIGAVELGAGGYSSTPHLDRAGVLSSEEKRRGLVEGLDAAGIELVALNVSGNPLHPDPEIAAAHTRDLRETVQLAAELGVTRVVAMSGCPAGRGPAGAGSWPVFAGGAWLPDMEGLWDVQWSERIAPFWSDLSSWALGAAPDVSICLELHPGTSIYNAESFLRLREVTGENVAVNFDPSHFWWQGIDPIVTLDAIGQYVGFAHGKDTVLHPDRIARHGVLDFRWPADAETMPWHFCAVGAGRSLEEWAALLAALRAGGYDGPISIEHEDPNLTAEAGVEASLAGLTAAGELLPSGLETT